MLFTSAGKVDAVEKHVEMASQEWIFPQNVLTVFSQTVFV